jgi:hypothetical protein
MLHACVERFDVMDGRGNILGWVGEVNKILTIIIMCIIASPRDEVRGVWFTPYLLNLVSFNYFYPNTMIKYD